MKSFDTRFSNKDGSKKAKELIMKVIYSVIYSVDDSARSENVRDITKIFEIKKAANQRLTAIVALPVQFSNLFLMDLRRLANIVI